MRPPTPPPSSSPASPSGATLQTKFSGALGNARGATDRRIAPSMSSAAPSNVPRRSWSNRSGCHWRAARLTALVSGRAPAPDARSGNDDSPGEDGDGNSVITTLPPDGGNPSASPGSACISSPSTNGGGANLPNGLRPVSAGSTVIMTLCAPSSTWGVSTTCLMRSGVCCALETRWLTNTLRISGGGCSSGAPATLMVGNGRFSATVIWWLRSRLRNSRSCASVSPPPPPNAPSPSSRASSPVAPVGAPPPPALTCSI
jgi:hypothetical protein